MATTTPPDVERILEQARQELLKIKDAKEIGQVTIHCGVDKFLLEVNRKLPFVKRENTDPHLIS